MTDEGFEFRPPTERRDAKQFEPPPWEREAFEELERKRAEQEALEAEERAAAQSISPQVAAAPPAEETASETAGADGDEADVEMAAAGEQVKAPAEAEMLEMLAGLAAEEPKPTTAYVPVALGTGLGLLALGSVLLIWAMAALVGSRQTGSMGQVGGAGLGLFGVFFLSMGVWLVYRTLKQRGVL